MANKKKGTTRKHYVGTDPHKWEGISSSYEAIHRDSPKRKTTAKEKHWSGMKVPKRTAATELGDVDAKAELQHRAQSLANAKTDKQRDTALNRLRSSLSSFEEMKEKSPVGKKMGYKRRITRKRGGLVSRRGGGKIMQGYKAGGKV
jgi:hypothetical protein